MGNDAWPKDLWSGGRLIGAALAAILGAAVLPAEAAAPAKVVTVHLQDATDDPSMAGMKLAADPDTVPAGPVSFVVTNDSKSVVHELLEQGPPQALGGPTVHLALHECGIQGPAHVLVGQEVVAAAQQVVVHPGDVRPLGVDSGRNPVRLASHHADPFLTRVPRRAR